MKEKPKGEQKNLWVEGFFAGAFIVAGIWWYMWILNDSQYEYQSCVEDCVFDMDMCVSYSWVYSADRKAFISEFEYESCSIELDSCVSSCEP